METTPSDPELVIKRTDLPGGIRRIDLMQGDRSVSQIGAIHAFTIHIGRAAVRMDGIGGVGTESDCRHRGYASRVLRAGIEVMQQGDAALSMLYGIPDFYPQFGYATAGPEHYMRLTEHASKYPMPEGWSVRKITLDDLPVVHQLYQRTVVGSVGAAIRTPDSRPWKLLAETAAGHNSDECCVVVDPQSEVRGYAWQSTKFWYVDYFEQYITPGTFILCEVIAADSISARALLSACRSWAKEGQPDDAPSVPITLPVPPDSLVAIAAGRQSAECIRRHARCGNSMARVVNVRRLLTSLLPELATRLEMASSPYRGAIRFVTEIGEATLIIAPEGIQIADEESDKRSDLGEQVILNLPQTALACLALGSYPPADILNDLPYELLPETAALLEILFPARYPHMYFPDRY